MRPGVSSEKRGRARKNPEVFGRAAVCRPVVIAARRRDVVIRAENRKTGSGAFPARVRRAPCRGLSCVCRCGCPCRCFRLRCGRRAAGCNGPARRRVFSRSGFRNVRFRTGHPCSVRDRLPRPSNGRSGRSTRRRPRWRPALWPSAGGLRFSGPSSPGERRRFCAAEGGALFSRRLLLPGTDGDVHQHSPSCPRAGMRPRV